jgi:hypothetical protein
MGNTEIATMFASHELRASADGLRWAIGRAGAMAIIWVQIAKTASRAVGRTQRDVHLIKQVEQVRYSALEGPIRLTSIDAVSYDSKVSM